MVIEIMNPSEAEQASLADEYDKALAFSADESAEYSLSHYRRMCRIVGYKLTPNASIRKKKTRLAAILVAAVMLFALVGCTVVVYREQIGAFFTEIFENHIKGSFAGEDDVNNQFINEYYTLTYIPEGYEIAEEKLGNLVARSIWNDADGNKLIFEQMPINSTNYFINNKTGITNVIELEDYTIYCRIIGDTYQCIWNDAEYAFEIYFDNETSEAEIIKIISKIAPIKK